MCPPSLFLPDQGLSIHLFLHEWLNERARPKYGQTVWLTDGPGMGFTTHQHTRFSALVRIEPSIGTQKPSLVQQQPRH